MTDPENKPSWIATRWKGLAALLVGCALVALLANRRWLMESRYAQRALLSTACKVDADCKPLLGPQWCATRRKGPVPEAEETGRCKSGEAPPVCHRDADCDGMRCEHGAHCNLEGFVPPRCACHATADDAATHARLRKEIADHERASGLVCDELADDFGRRSCRPIDGGAHDPGGDGGPSP